MAKKKTTKKTATQARKLPELLLFVVCDAVSRDPNTGKISLYGIFDKIWTEKLPSSIPLLNVLIRLKGGAGKHTAELEIIDPKGMKIKNEGRPIEIKCLPGAVSEINAQFVGIPLEIHGSYKFVLKVDNRMLGKPHEIQVEKRKKDKKK